MSATSENTSKRKFINSKFYNEVVDSDEEVLDSSGFCCFRNG